MADNDPIGLNLEIYDTKNGLWNPDHGDLQIPDGWEFLPSGDTFVTRHVKAGGVYWVLWRPRGRREHRRKLGLLAPTETINTARAAAVATEPQRVVRRASNAKSRDRAEASYRSAFAGAVFRWLAFGPEHEELADEIARGAAEQAAVVGSGRVTSAVTNKPPAGSSSATAPEAARIRRVSSASGRDTGRSHGIGRDRWTARSDPTTGERDATIRRPSSPAATGR